MRFNPRLSTTALVIALGATLALPAAGHASGVGPVVRPNPDEQILTTPAKPTPPAPPAASAVQPNPDEQTLMAPDTRPGPSLSTPAVIVRVNNTKSGFDWGDAGIGAAAALGLSLIALAGGLAVSHRSARRSKEPTTVAS
jgi:hypothetical protein